MTATLITAAAREIALKLAKGNYQRGMIYGSHSWAGSDLRGAAGRYGGRYRDSRESLIAAMKAAGLRVVVETIGERGRRVATILTAAEAKRIPVTAIGGDARVEARALQARIERIAKKATAARRKADRAAAVAQAALSDLAA